MRRKDVFHSQPDVMSGASVFKEARAPVATLFHYLEAGDGLDVFVDHLPALTFGLLWSQAIHANG